MNECMIIYFISSFTDKVGLLDPEDPDALVRHLSSYLRPMLLESWTKRRNTVLMESAARRRQLLDNLQKQLDEVRFLFFSLCCYNKFHYCIQRLEQPYYRCSFPLC